MPRKKFPGVQEVAMLPITNRATVSEDWIDSMGHMNVMWYMHLFSQAVLGLLPLFGLDREVLKSSGRGTFALETHIHYLSELRVGSQVVVHSRILGRSEKRMHFIHFMVNQDDNRLSATSEIVNAIVDLNTRRMAGLPEEIASRCDRVISEHAALPWTAPTTGSMGPGR